MGADGHCIYTLPKGVLEPLARYEAADVGAVIVDNSAGVVEHSREFLHRVGEGKDAAAEDDELRCLALLYQLHQPLRCLIDVDV